MAPKESRQQNPSEIIKVGMWEWLPGEGEQVLQTIGLGPCIGIATYEAATRRGHLGHFVAPHDQDPTFSRFLQSVKTSSRDISAVQAWIRGGSHLAFGDAEDIAHGRECRAFVRLALAGAGIEEANIDTAWANPDETVSMTLDCSNGEFTTGIDHQDEVHAYSDMDDDAISRIFPNRF